MALSVSTSFESRPDVKEVDREILAANLTRFEKNLETPTRFNRTKSKGFYRRTTRGIAWFKDTASDHLARMRVALGFSEPIGQPVPSRTNLGHPVQCHLREQMIRRRMVSSVARRQASEGGLPVTTVAGNASVASDDWPRGSTRSVERALRRPGRAADA